MVGPLNNNFYKTCLHLGKTHIKKVVILMVRPLRFYPPYTKGLVVHSRGVYPPYTLSGPTTKKNTFFICVFPY